MKRFFTGCVAIAVLVALVGCSTGSSNDTTSTTTATTKNVPSKLAVDVPKAIQGTSSTASASMRVVASNKSQAYTEITGMTKSMLMLEGMAGFYAIIADEIITQNPTIANAGKQTVTLTLTQSMVDKVITLMGGNDAIDLTDLQKEVGQSASLDATYTTTGSGDSKYVMDVTSDGQTVKLSWNEAKTVAKLVLDMGTSGNITFNYNGTDNQMSLIFDMSGMTMNLSLQTKGTGAVVLCSMKDTNGVYTMKGYADDKGGYITMSYTQASNGTTTSASESFDASGTIITDTGYKTTFTDAQTSGEVSAADMSGTDAYVVATTLADGDYFTYQDNTLTSTNFSQAKFIGSGYVADKYLAITPMSDAAATYLKTSGNTVYIYPITWNGDGTYTLGTTSTITIP